MFVVAVSTLSLKKKKTKKYDRSGNELLAACDAVE